MLGLFCVCIQHLGFQAEPASLHSSQKLWRAEHGIGGLTVRQRAGACNQRLSSHLTSLSREKTGQAQVSASAGLIHHQGFWHPRRHLFQTWRILCNENPSSLPCKPCALGLVSSNWSPTLHHRWVTGERQVSPQRLPRRCDAVMLLTEGSGPALLAIWGT